MLIDPASLVCFFGGTIIAFYASSSLTSAQARRQQEIARRGRAATGRIVDIRRPLLAGFTRLYIEFELPGTRQAVRACHIDRRDPGGLNASLPSIGTTVTIKYLPERPREAVIAKLVPSFVR